MSRAPYQHIRTADDLRHTADTLGSHFFSPGTMHWFNSRLLSPLFPVETSTAQGRACGYFVTSERYGHDAPRHYAVRVYWVHRDADGRDTFDVWTVTDADGDALHYSTAREAKRVAAELAASGRASREMSAGVN